MKVVSVIAQKGGAGKTTTTAALSVAAVQAGFTVAAVDLDPQGTLASWWDRREESTPPVVSAQAVRLPHVLEAARSEGVELAFIDTPSRVEQAARAAALAADLVIVPCRPSIYDLETVTTTLELVTFARKAAPEIPLIALLTNVPAQGPRQGQAEKVLEAAGLSICPVVFGHRVAFEYAATMGLTPQEYEPDGKAAVEVRDAFKYFCQHVGLTPC